MGNQLVALLVALLVAACASSSAGELSILHDVECVRDSEAPGPDIWESAIQGYEAADARQPPDPGSVVFVGSSSVVFWGSLSEELLF